MTLNNLLLSSCICICLLVLPDQAADGRLGPSTVVLDHTSGFEGLLFVDDDLLGVGTNCSFVEILHQD